MLNFRKIAAASDGAKILDYYSQGKARTLSTGKSERQGLDPAGRTLETGQVLAGYYNGPESLAILRPDMPRSVARALGLAPARAPTKSELENLFEARRADTGAAWSETKRELSGFDLVFSPHKSVSLAAEFAKSPAEAAAIRHAVLGANQDALRYAAADLGFTRRGHAGKDGVEAGEIGWLSFIHDAARQAIPIQDGPDGGTYLSDAPVAGDPHFHVHNFVPNLVVTDTGHAGSLDARALTSAAVHEYGAYFQAKLADRLRDLGARVGYDADAQAIVLTDIPKEANDLFSKRDSQVLHEAKSFAKENSLDWDTLDYDYKMRILHEASKSGRLGKSKDDAREFWHEQAAAIGWEHDSVMNAVTPTPLTEERRFDLAYEHAARHLVGEFKRNSVIDARLLRVHAARGLIGTGISGSRRDVDHVVGLLLDRGIEIKGKPSALVTGMRKGTLHVTHKAQIEIETSLSLAARRAATDTSGALSARALRDAIEDIERSDAGIAFSAEQRAAIHALGQGPKIGLLTGVAGSGKTTLLRPLVAAWKKDGRTIVGTSTAWRQADALKDAGIDETVALQPLLRSIDEGRFQPDKSTVLVIDEVSQISPRSMLRLMDLQAKTGMTLEMLGDREQCQSIDDAGDTIELLRRVLPKHSLPEVLTSVRQKNERDREIASLFREGRTAEAFEMKREDGTARLVEGDYDQVLDQVADFVIARNDLLCSVDKRYSMSVTTLTNAEAADLSRAIRRRLKERGEIGADEVVYKAVNYRGDKPELFDLPIATGDKLRLYRRAWAKIDGKGGTIGSNGDLVEVRGHTSKGLLLRNERGQTGEVEWRRLRDEATGRLLLGFGRVFTVDSAQGMSTKGEHLDLFARGTHTTNAFKAYTAESRATGRTFTFVSKAAVLADMRRKRALGDITPITDDDIWSSIEKDLAAKPYKSLAVDLLPKSARYWENGVRTSFHPHQRLETVPALAANMLATRDAIIASKAYSGLLGEDTPPSERDEAMLTLAMQHLEEKRGRGASANLLTRKPRLAPTPAEPDDSRRRNQEPDTPAPANPSPEF